ncbi:DUF819 domain-containing protein [Marilutibacter penaei]|uniref:DUF819 family protein n=1 Tax=Marilutibacter penaei TaxID=2759900 RepID=UPI001C724909|nr:DUF819 family protein [Lysobacter penaei]
MPRRGLGRTGSRAVTTPGAIATLVPADNAFALLAVFFGLAAIGARLERTRIGQRVSGVMIVIALAMALANLGVIPRSAPTYGVVWQILVPLSIALFLLRADLVSMVVEGGRTLVAFVAGVFGVVAGAWLGALLLDLGPHEAEFAAVFGATYTGGSLNYAAVAEAIGFRDPTALAAGIAIDNVVGLGYLLMVGAVANAALFRRHFGWRSERLHEAADGDAINRRPPSLIDLSIALALAALACASGDAIAAAIGQPSYGILFITAIMVAIATIGRRWLRGLSGEDLVATLFMYLFFAMLGAGADLRALLDAAPALFAYVLVLFAVHIAFVLLAGRLFRLNHAELVIASTACIGGPPIAIAFAVLFGWRRLAVPAVATGILGYVVGNFVGIGLYRGLS